MKQLYQKPINNVLLINGPDANHYSVFIKSMQNPKYSGQLSITPASESLIKSAKSPTLASKLIIKHLELKLDILGDCDAGIKPEDIAKYIGSSVSKLGATDPLLIIFNFHGKINSDGDHCFLIDSDYDIMEPNNTVMNTKEFIKILKNLEIKQDVIIILHSCYGYAAAHNFKELPSNFLTFSFDASAKVVNGGLVYNTWEELFEAKAKNLTFGQFIDEFNKQVDANEKANLIHKVVLEFFTELLDKQGADTVKEYLTCALDFNSGSVGMLYNAGREMKPTKKLEAKNVLSDYFHGYEGSESCIKIIGEYTVDGDDL